MLLITITNWRQKLGVILRLIFFLILIGLAIPQFLNFITGQLVNLRDHSEKVHPPALRVEKEGSGSGQKNTLFQDKDKSFIRKLEQFYYGAKQKPEIP